MDNEHHLKCLPKNFSPFSLEINELGWEKFLQRENPFGGCEKRRFSNGSKKVSLDRKSVV